MNNVLKKAFAPVEVTSLESLVGEADGSTKLEREYEIYGRVDDLEALAEKASRVEYHEQWGLPCTAGADAGVQGSIRVRMTREGDDGEPKYTMTIKVKQANGNEENEMEITEDTFKIFSRLVPTGLLKKRYIFPVEGTDHELEVDVFHDLDGNQHNVVKIDLEVPEGVDITSVTVPFKIEDARVISPGKKSPEDLEYVRDLFSNHYEVKNPAHQKAEGSAEEGGEEDAADDADAEENSEEPKVATAKIN